MGVSFIGIFIVVYNILFFVCGLARSLAWDYAPGVPQGEEAETRVPWREKPIGSLVHRYLLGSSPPQPPTISVPQRKVDGTPELDVPTVTREGEKSTSVQVTASSQPDRGSTALPVHTWRQPSTTASPLNPRFKQFLQTLSMALAPMNLVIAASLCIALVQPLKALFVDVSSEGGPSWKGPDGRPPLAFIIDAGSLMSCHSQCGQLIPFPTASFIGAITIPLSLVLLGASFARMKIPRPISRLPIAAVLSVCVAKLVLLPTIGVLIVQAMVRGGLIPRQNKAQIFVAMYLSGTPTSITYAPDSTVDLHGSLTPPSYRQLIVSSLHSPNGDLDTLSVSTLTPVIPRTHLTALGQAFLLAQCE